MRACNKNHLEWIDADRWKPDPRQKVLLYRRGWYEDKTVGYWDNDEQEWIPVAGFAFPGVTHWAVLPDGPVETVED